MDWSASHKAKGAFSNFRLSMKKALNHLFFYGFRHCITFKPTRVIIASVTRADDTIPLQMVMQ